MSKALIGAIGIVGALVAASVIRSSTDAAAAESSAAAVTQHARESAAENAGKSQNKEKEKSFTRTQVQEIIGAARKIVTPNGVEELLEIPIGGARQWISVRGRDRSNPVLLMIHGGPASPEMPTSWFFQIGWEDYFTVVQWDQRGAGKTYNANDPAAIEPTLTFERMVADASEVIQYVRTRYGKKKVFVLGHSWGSLIGVTLARRHPEWLHAYVGMGQIISGYENERVGFARTLQAARAAGNEKAVRELKALEPYPQADGSVSVHQIIVERDWSVFFGGLTHGRKDLKYYYDLVNFSPEYTAADVDAIDKGSSLSLARFLPVMTHFDYDDVVEFDCPIVLFQGRHDNTTPSEVGANWLQRVKAPAKKLVWFENSAHMMMVEEPGRLLVHLVQDVRPFAK